MFLRSNLHEPLLESKSQLANFSIFEPSKEFLERELEDIDDKLIFINNMNEKYIYFIYAQQNKFPPDLHNHLNFEKINKMIRKDYYENLAFFCCILTGSTALLTAGCAGYFGIIAAQNSCFALSATEGAKEGALLGLKLGSSVGSIGGLCCSTLNCICQNDFCCCGAKEPSATLKKLEDDIHEAIKRYNQAPNLETKLTIVAELQHMIDKPIQRFEASIKKLELRKLQIQKQISSKPPERMTMEDGDYTATSALI